MKTRPLEDEFCAYALTFSKRIDIALVDQHLDNRYCLALIGVLHPPKRCSFAEISATIYGRIECDFMKKILPSCCLIRCVWIVMSLSMQTFWDKHNESRVCRIVPFFVYILESLFPIFPLDFLIPNNGIIDWRHHAWKDSEFDWVRYNTPIRIGKIAYGRNEIFYK